MIKFVSNRRTVIDPWKYFTKVGEVIYFDEAGGYLHVDSDGSLLFKNCVFPDIEKTNIVENFDFELGFRMMTNDLIEKETRLIENPLFMNFDKKIIIGGCGRSGTTLMLSIMGSHSKIYAIDEETHVFYPPPIKLPRLENILSKRIGKEIHWCEKTPKNILAYNQILSILGEGCRIINMVRDPRDVITSLHPNGGKDPWVSKERWIEDNSSLVDDPRIATIKFEDLLKDPDRTLRIICDHVGIEFENRMRSHERFSNVKNNIAWSKSATAIGKMNSESRSEERWDNKLVDDLMRDERAIRLMTKFGYV